MSDLRPSITELQRMLTSAEPWIDDGIPMLLRTVPALLEIAAAALAHRSASKRAAAARFAWSRASGEPDEDVRFDAMRDADRNLHAASTAYDVALAKVRL